MGRVLPCLLLAAAASFAGEPRDDAWAAYRAGEQGHAGAVPELRRLLAQYTQRQEPEAASVQGAVLDALIRLRADLPWSELAPVFEKHRDEVVILLVRHSQALDALRGILGGGSLSFLQWNAVCNRLVEQKAPGLAAHLMKELKLKLVVHVVNRGDMRGFGFGRSVSSGRSCGVVTVPAGWPPRVIYSLHERGGTLLAPGKHPVYYHRKVIEKRGGIGSSRSGSWKQNRYRLDYLAQLLDLEKPPLTERDWAEIVWHDAERYRKELHTHRGTVVDRYRRVVASLLDRGLLTRDEANRLEPKIKIEIQDRRSDKTTPLPNVRS